MKIELYGLLQSSFDCHILTSRLWRCMVIHKGLVINLYRYSEALVIAQILLKDKNELIHKAVGWMLREVENRNREVEDRFLCKYKEDISRTMLRYAIDKFPEKTPDVFGVCVTNMKFKVKIR